MQIRNQLILHIHAKFQAFDENKLLIIEKTGTILQVMIVLTRGNLK